MSLRLANPPAPLVRWRGGYPIKTSGSVEILDCPGTTDAADHPPQNSPKVPVQRVAIDRLKRVDDCVDFDARWEGLATTADEDERVDNSGRGANEAGLGKPFVIETEYADKEIAKFWVMSNTIFRQAEGESLAIQIRFS